MSRFPLWTRFGMLLGFLPLAFASGGLSSNAMAQPGGRAWAERTLKFVEAKPTLGDRLPKVNAFDADGKKINLSDIKGSYAVLVFGCLT